MKIRKTGIIGLGHVGAHVAYALALQGITDEIVMTDVRADKVKSEQQDLIDSMMFLPHPVRVTVGEYEDLADCDVIINSSGKIELLIGNEDRTSELRFTIPQVRKWAPALKAAGFDGILINISNPCDVVTREAAKILDLPAGHVFGTGTGLDTARLRSQIALTTGVDPRSISAYMLGEHGNAQFAAWSCVSLNGMPLDELKNLDPKFDFDRNELQQKAIRGGWVTFSGKHCTEYAVASTAARMASAVYHDEKCIVPASTQLNGEYGEKDVFAGVPVVLGKNGVEHILELPITEAEREKFHECTESIRRNMALADSLE